MGKFFSRLIVFAVVAVMLAASVELFREVRQYQSDVTAVSTEQTQQTQKKKQKNLNATHKAVATEYYYSTLEEDERETYAAILEHLEAQEDSFSVQETDERTIKRMYQFVLYDHPELFWVNGSMQYTVYSGWGAHAEIQPEYTVSPSERRERNKHIRRRVKKFIAQIPSDASDYQKVKLVFDTLADRVEYDTQAVDGQNICSALLNGRSVCAGYAKSAQLLLEQLGIPCIYVTGTIDKGDSHAWNIVKVDGEYYNFDVTFGDRVFEQSSSDTLLADSNKDYNYLLCTDEELYRDRQADHEVRFPKCRSMKDNYYVRNGCYFDRMDTEALRSVVQRSLEQGRHDASCKFASAELYEQGRTYLLDTIAVEQAQNYAQQTGSSTARYAYVENQTMHEITVAWGS